jgi:two-component system osmolarity sensor histidine kinase EnvZ
VFRPFYRAEEARTLDGRGVGLGLAVARSIARSHGGDVSLSTGAGGLTARVRLPLSAS